jgi:cobalt-zinc-cadmium efflux system outer membrane protein
MRPWKVVMLCGLLLAGCRSGECTPGRSYVAAEIERRVAHQLAPVEFLQASCDRVESVPGEVSFDDGLSEDEAVALALRNNAAFLEALADLGFSRADLVQAGLLTNPVLSVLFPLGPKQLEFTATFPVEALWLRPRRVQIAEVDVERVANRLVQAGLDLTRDVRVAYSDLYRAGSRVRLADQAVALLEEIAKVAEARARAGEASEVEGNTARLEVLRAKEEQYRLTQEVTLARARLDALMGGGSFNRSVELNEPRQLIAAGFDLQALLADSQGARPDLRAAELSVEAACHRAELAKIDYLTVAGLLDANGKGSKGFEAGPGLLVTLPIFHRNQGARTRTVAEIERSIRQVHTVHDRIELEVRTSYALYEQSRHQLETWRSEILPTAEQAVRVARKAFEGGDASYLFVLETTRQALDARVREVESEASLRRALAELERNVGRRLDDSQMVPQMETTPCITVLP